MDFKAVREQSDAQKRRDKKILIAAAVLVGIIAVQCVTIGAQHVINNMYQGLYNESLEKNITLQETINKLKYGAEGNSEDSEAEIPAEPDSFDDAAESAE